MYWENEGWYSLLERVSNRFVGLPEAVALANRGKQADGDVRWAMPRPWLTGLKAAIQMLWLTARTICPASF